MTRITDVMGRDHARLEQLFARYRAKKQAPSAAALFSEFRTGLLKHIGWEEEVLFPMLQDKARSRERGPSAFMRLEHQEIKDLLESIQKRVTGAAKGGTREYEERLAELLREHDHKEEIVLYPWIDQALDEDERLEALEKLMGSVACL